MIRKGKLSIGESVETLVDSINTMHRWRGNLSAPVPEVCILCTTERCTSFIQLPVRSFNEYLRDCCYDMLFSRWMVGR